MTVLLFLLVIVLLVLVHELGHFSVAKFFNIRVDEFSIGFPPRVASYTIGETRYSLGALPFGGFVKIFGEDAESHIKDTASAARALNTQRLPVQTAVLAAGVTANVILGWILITLGLSLGLPVSSSALPEGTPVSNREIIIVSVEQGSPAFEAGIEPGSIVRVIDGELPSSIASVQEHIAARANLPVRLGVRSSGGEDRELQLVPRYGVVPNQAGIGIGMDEVAQVELPLLQALILGFSMTVRLLYDIVVALTLLIRDAFGGGAALEQVVGPVGLAGLVGAASSLGFVHVLALTAIISLHLAVINLIPFPALDGGRILFLLIEGLRGKPLSQVVVQRLNFAGFVILITLMLLVTYSDIARLLL